MTDFIPDTERILIIEDTRELQIDKPNIVNMECQNDTYTENRVSRSTIFSNTL